MCPGGVARRDYFVAVARRSSDTGWIADLWHARSSYSSELDCRLGKMAGAMECARPCGFDDLAFQRVTTALLDSMDWSEPRGVSGSRSCRARRLCVWSLDARIMVPASAFDLSDGRHDLAVFRSSGGVSSG